MYIERFGLDGKVAIVTGASRGIGASVASALAEAGAAVVLSSRKEEALLEVKKEIEAAGGKAIVIPAHTGKVEETKKLVEQTVSELGRLDVLVNNAATNPYFGPAVGCDEKAFDNIMEVNLRGPFFLCKAAFPHLAKDGGGSIVNVASIGGVVPMPMIGVYSISKAALISMTKLLAQEWAGGKVRVNAIAPGLTDTKFAGALLSNPAISKKALERIPIGRFADPDEMAAAVLYLASDASSYVTGEVLVLDGGSLVS